MTSATSKAKADAVLVESVSRFAPRLYGRGFYCEQQPGPSKKTVRYLVKLKDDNRLLGHIAWKGAWNCYAFFSTSETVYAHHCLAELAEILDYLSKRQRRIVATGRRQG